ncbi:hypothetical protein J6590_004734 [Homalodisca vitripennis]|nr:hypothetical protein J6590_004734 [Homalodisca vitripennis]
MPWDKTHSTKTILLHEKRISSWRDVKPFIIGIIPAQQGLATASARAALPASCSGYGGYRKITRSSNVTAERSCPCKRPACPAIGGGSEVTYKPLVPRLSVREGFLALTSPDRTIAVYTSKKYCVLNWAFVTSYGISPPKENLDALLHCKGFVAAYSEGGSSGLSNPNPGFAPTLLRCGRACRYKKPSLLTPQRD